MTISLFNPVSEGTLREATVERYSAILASPYINISFKDMYLKDVDTQKAVKLLLEGSGVKFDDKREFIKALEGKSFNKDHALQASISLRYVRTKVKLLDGSLQQQMENFLDAVLNLFDEKLGPLP